MNPISAEGRKPPPQSPPPRPTTERAEPPRGNPPRANAPPGPGNGCYLCGSPFHFKSHCPQMRAQNSRFQPYPPRSEPPPPPGRRPLNITPPHNPANKPPRPGGNHGTGSHRGGGVWRRYGGGKWIPGGARTIGAQVGHLCAANILTGDAANPGLDSQHPSQRVHKDNGHRSKPPLCGRTVAKEAMKHVPRPPSKVVCPVHMGMFETQGDDV